MLSEYSKLGEKKAAIKNAVESVDHAAALVEGYAEDSAESIGLVL